MDTAFLPTFNACLNSLSFLFLLFGWICLKQRRLHAHKRLMWAACLTSLLFLLSYLYYHAQAGSVKFQGQGIIRPFYFAILISHSLLAAAIVPMALMTLWKATRGQFRQHAAIARWTWPLWMYVSVTGVAVYWMLYRL